MGTDCIHCRELRLENERKSRQRARLTEEQRFGFGLIVRPLIPISGCKPALRDSRPERRGPALRNVLPANFTLPAG